VNPGLNISNLFLNSLPNLLIMQQREKLYIF